MDSILQDKSYTFAISIVKLAQFFQKEQKEFVISNQILKSGTSMGALIREAEFAQSQADYINKFYIGLKEANETNYWLNLLKDTGYIDGNNFTNMEKDNKELIKLANKNIPSDAPLDVAGPAAQPEVDPNKKMIAFTLDDGPHKTNTLKVVEMFEKYNGRATFFELGKNITLYPDVVKTVYEHGFEIASHSWDHPDLRKLDAEGLNKQIVDTQNAIYKITGAEPTLIRPPYGAFNDNVKSVVKNNGMEIALWSVDTLDWKLKDANKIKETIINNSYDGAVVLLHDIHNFSVEGLEMALGELYNRGYQFVTLDTLKQYKDLKTVFR